MFKRFAHIALLSCWLISTPSFSQVKSKFSGDIGMFKEELTAFMGPNLNEAQKLNLSSFLMRWDSTAYSEKNKTIIINISNHFAARAMRAVPHFNDFITTLNSVVEESVPDNTFTEWMESLDKLTLESRNNNDYLDKYIVAFHLLIKSNILSQTSSQMRWVVEGATPLFSYDTAFKVSVSDATLKCYSQKDSTEIHDVSGTYYPMNRIFQGERGTIYFDKAGLPTDEVFATISDYRLDMTKNNFTIDSALLTHHIYFPTPIYGSISDRSITYRDKSAAAYPRFVTYEKEYELNDIYEGVDYIGGVSFEGAKMKGNGTTEKLANLYLSRNDTLYMKISSLEYLFSNTGLAGSEVRMVLYLDKDSIYHANLGMSYNTEKQQINLFKTNTPVSGSPYFDSYHKLDMYFDRLSWNMNESKIVLSRAIGAALGQAQFESSDFFNENYFYRLAGIDQYHPLVRFKNFAEWYYSNTFPIEEFAKWLNKPQDAVTGLCIDMANKGFIFYDREFNEITLKDKTLDYLSAVSHRKDYDVISIYSETQGLTDNAILNLSNYKLAINGVQSIFLSDTQRVAIVPYGRNVTISKNRRMEFDGIVEAGLFTIYGHNFSFDYDTFNINLHSIDSIRIAVEVNDEGNVHIEGIENVIQMTSAEIFIDAPNNKSGLHSLPQYPIINSTASSYIFYDDIPGMEGLYPQDAVYFKIDPFNFENINHYSMEDLDLSGEFVAEGILEPMRQQLTIQEDNSLGFHMNIPETGVPVYGGKGVFYENLFMDNKGLHGSGSLKHLSSVSKSEMFSFFPDSMVAEANNFEINKEGVLFPQTKCENVSIRWLPKDELFFAKNSDGKSFDMFDNNATLDGSLLLSSSQLQGEGVVNTLDSRITSTSFSFSANAITADTSTYNLKSPTTTGYAFIAENAHTNIDFEQQKATFHLNASNSVVIFPEIQFNCTMSDFTYDISTKILDMKQKGDTPYKLLTSEELLAVDFNNLNKPTFLSTNVIGDTLSFSSWTSKYFVDEEYIVAQDIEYLHIADALIQPDSGTIVINRRASVKPLKNAIIAVNNKHLLHDADITIESTKRYSGSAKYDYISEDNDIQEISFEEVTVDTMRSSGKGHIVDSQNFKLSPAFSYSGDVEFRSNDDFLSFTGAAGIVNTCDGVESRLLKFKASIDPKNVMIPISDKPRDRNDNLLFSGSYINIDSSYVQPAFLSLQKSWTDVTIVSADGYLWYDKSKSSYLITSLNKIADPTINGNMLVYDNANCLLSGEGVMDFGANFNLVKMAQTGSVTHNIDSGIVDIHAMLAFDFFFSTPALETMANEIKTMPTLTPVDISSQFYDKAMKDLIGPSDAEKLKIDMGLYGMIREMPANFSYNLVLNDVNLTWNESSSSLVSTGKIGIGFIGNQSVNVYVDGYVEIQRRRSGDMFDIYLKADDATWYYFSYMRGNMMSHSGNNAYNSIIINTKEKDRKHPQATVREPYSYMITVEDRLPRFLRRMEEYTSPEQPVGEVLVDEFNQ